MNCQEVMELMQRYLDKDLNEPETRTLLRHLQQCPECTEMFERLKRLSNDLESLPKVLPPYSIVDSILPQLEQLDRLGREGGVTAEESASAERSVAQETDAFSNERSPKERLPAGKWPWSRKISWGWAGGVIAAGIVLGVVVFQQPAIRQNADELLLGSAGKQSAESSAASDAGSRKQSDPAAGSAGANNMSDSAADRVQPNAAPVDPNAPVSSAAGANAPKAEPKQNEAAAPAPGGAAAGAGQPPQPQSAPAGGQAAPEAAQKPQGTAEQFQAQNQFGTFADKTAPGENAPARPDSPASRSMKQPAAAGAQQPASGGSGAAGSDANSAGGAAGSGAAGGTGAGGGVNALALGGGQAAATAPDAKAAPEGAATAVPGLTAAPAQPRLSSPDGTYTAVIEDHRVVVRRTDGGDIVYTSIMQWQAGDRIVLKEWSDNARLIYEVDYAKGSKRIVIDVVDKTEISQNK